MGKTVKRQKKTATAESDPALEYFAGIDAKSQLFSGLIGMGWRLALTVLIPIFIGVQIDKRLDSSPSATLTAFFIAILASGLLIQRTYKEMMDDAAEVEAKDKKPPKQRKNHV